MSVRLINSTDSINKIHELSQEIAHIKQKLDENIPSEIETIISIPMLERIRRIISDLETRLNSSCSVIENIDLNLSFIKHIKIDCENAYHKCMTSKLFFFTKIYVDTELALKDNQNQIYLPQNQHEIITNIKKELIQLSASPILNQDEKRSVTNFLSITPHLLCLLEKKIKNDFSISPMEVEKPLNEEIEGYSNIGYFASSAPEILLHLLSFLSAKDLVTFSRCSTSFNNLCKDDSIWKKILQREFPSFSILKNESAKQTYISHKSILKSLKNGYYASAILIKEDSRFPCLFKDKNLLFLGFVNHTIKIWDLTNLECIKTLIGHEASVFCLYKEDNLLFSGSSGSIKIWDLTDLTNIRCIATLDEHQAPVYCLHKQGNLLFSGSGDHTIKIWDLTDLNNIKCIATLKEHIGFVRHLLKEDNLLFSGSEDNTIKIWNLADLNNIKCITTLNGYHGRRGYFLKEGNLLFCGFSSGTIKIWDLTDLTNIHCITTLLGHKGVIHYLQKEGNLLFSASEDETIKVWDLNANGCLHTLKGHLDSVVYIKKEGNRLFSASNDKTIKEWSLNSSLEDTLLNLADMMNEVFKSSTLFERNEKLKVFIARIQKLPLLIQAEIYAEFYKIRKFEEDYLGCAEDAFLELQSPRDDDEKKRQAIYFYVLKRVLILFKNDHAKDAMDLFNKLPQKIKDQIENEYYKNKIFNEDDHGYIKAIQNFINIPKPT